MDPIDDFEDFDTFSADRAAQVTVFTEALQGVDDARALSRVQQEMLIHVTCVHWLMMFHGATDGQGPADTFTGWQAIRAGDIGTWHPDLIVAIAELAQLIQEHPGEWESCSERVFDLWLPSRLIREFYRLLFYRHGTDDHGHVDPDALAALQAMDGEEVAGQEDNTNWARRMEQPPEDEPLK